MAECRIPNASEILNFVWQLLDGPWLSEKLISLLNKPQPQSKQ